MGTTQVVREEMKFLDRPFRCLLLFFKKNLNKVLLEEAYQSTSHPHFPFLFFLVFFVRSKSLFAFFISKDIIMMTQNFKDASDLDQAGFSSGMRGKRGIGKPVVAAIISHRQKEASV